MRQCGPHVPARRLIGKGGHRRSRIHRGQVPVRDQNAGRPGKAETVATARGCSASTRRIRKLAKPTMAPPPWPPPPRWAKTRAGTHPSTTQALKIQRTFNKEDFVILAPPLERSLPALEQPFSPCPSRRTPEFLSKSKIEFIVHPRDSAGEVTQFSSRMLHKVLDAGPAGAGTAL